MMLSLRSLAFAILSKHEKKNMQLKREKAEAIRIGGPLIVSSYLITSRQKMVHVHFAQESSAGHLASLSVVMLVNIQWHPLHPNAALMQHIHLVYTRAPDGHVTLCRGSGAPGLRCD